MRPHITSFSHIGNPSGMSKPHVDAARRRVSTHVAKRVNCPRAAGIRACCALTSRRLATSGTSKPHVDAARRWVSTCSEMSEMSASRRYSCLFCAHITSFSHIRNVETPCGRRPEVGFNTCSETSELSARRRYSCLILQSHHLVSSHQQ